MYTDAAGVCSFKPDGPSHSALQTDPPFWIGFNLAPLSQRSSKPKTGPTQHTVHFPTRCKIPSKKKASSVQLLLYLNVQRPLLSVLPDDQDLGSSSWATTKVTGGVT